MTEFSTGEVGTAEVVVVRQPTLHFAVGALDGEQIPKFPVWHAHTGGVLVGTKESVGDARAVKQHQVQAAPADIESAGRERGPRPVDDPRELTVFPQDIARPVVEMCEHPRFGGKLAPSFPHRPIGPADDAGNITDNVAEPCHPYKRCSVDTGKRVPQPRGPWKRIGRHDVRSPWQPRDQNGRLAESFPRRIGVEQTWRETAQPIERGQHVSLATRRIVRDVVPSQHQLAVRVGRPDQMGTGMSTACERLHLSHCRPGTGYTRGPRECCCRWLNVGHRASLNGSE